jgi:hypothetical protein
MENGQAASKRDWRKVVSQKGRQQTDAIRAVRDLTAQQGDENVTAIDDIAILAKKIAKGEFRSEDVVKSYIAK